MYQPRRVSDVNATLEPEGNAAAFRSAPRRSVRTRSQLMRTRVAPAAVSVALLGPMAGPYALIVFAALAGALWPLSVYYPSPGGSDERVHLFVGRCDSVGAGGIHGLEEEGEDIRVHVWPLEDALQAVKDGRIDNAASIIALQWLALNRAEVRGLWS